jgi:UDP-glucuronate decarboxylase
LKMMNGPDDFIGPVNLGNPTERKIQSLAELIIELTGSKSKIEFREQPMDDPKRRRPDITIANEKLGWKPVISLEEGLKKTIQYFRELLDI